ncbi:M13 family metallopeptidase [Mesoterricola silvestris]|uniref:Peptidase M13 n=1 Tax=Mesoterricola silvestris TaxID=2927979 RepID=A0AA48GLE0_9BACT|nr:M13 family metallopeptidase [Mesoterricola silvestris]BDU71605.1 peptidase M13 [Mesoterricola silvestris]
MTYRPTHLAALCAFTACAVAAPPPAPKADYLATVMDTSVDPGVDFFTYAVGGWLKRNPIPPSESVWGIGKVLREQTYANLRAINEQAAAKPTDADSRKVGDFWAAASDEARTERLGLGPLKAELAKVDALRSARDAVNLAFAWAPLRTRAFFAVSVEQDEKNSDEMAVHLYQGGLGLPERDFYFNPEKGVARIREAYLTHLDRTLHLLGRDKAGDAAIRVMAFETALAKAARKLEELRDPEKNYNKMTPAELTASRTPSIPWAERFGEWGLRPATVIVGQPEFFGALETLLASTPVAVLQDYLRLRLVDTYADYLGKAFQEEHFKFYGQALSGQRQPRDRWKRVLDAQEQAMGMLLGKLFVKQYFTETAKRRYDAMVEGIRGAYKERIERLDWMSPETKAKAQVKLAGITKKVGYPDRWKDFSALVVTRDSYCGNMMNASRWRFADMLSRFGKPVDRTEWHMTPQTYNAYYNPSNNEIVLPAAQMMVPGVADADLDDALVYGYTGGSTIGHEITHGFDDEGRQFDAKGNLADWWTPEDGAKFNARAAGMIRQFDAYEPLPGLHINGKASLGENIADFGGILLGIDAFKKTEQYRKGEKIGGLTPMQRYFLGYALGWMTQQKDEALRTRLLSDVHSPAKWRVIGPLSNIPEFHQAFGVKEGQPMWRSPADCLRIW